MNESNVGSDFFINYFVFLATNQRKFVKNSSLFGETKLYLPEKNLLQQETIFRSQNENTDQVLMSIENNSLNNNNNTSPPIEGKKPSFFRKLSTVNFVKNQ